MGKPHPVELRERVVALVFKGHGHREALQHVRVAPRFVNNLIKLRREIGALAPRLQGNGGGFGELAGVTCWIEARRREGPEYARLGIGLISSTPVSDCSAFYERQECIGRFILACCNPAE